MSAGQATALQTALYARLVSQLATAGPGGTALAVFDHVAVNPAVAHARLESFSLLPVETKNTSPALHRFTVRLFDGDGAGATATRGQMQIKAMQAAVIAAFEEWRPIAGGSAVRHLGSTIPPSETGSGWEAASRFEVYL